MSVMPDAEMPSSSENQDKTPEEPSRPASAAPRIRIQRGATVYAPWRRADPGPSAAPPSTSPQKTKTPTTSGQPSVPAAPPLNFATPSVAPTVIIRPAPGSQHWVADEFGSEPTIEMTVEFAAVMGDETPSSEASEAPLEAPEAPLEAPEAPLEAVGGSATPEMIAPPAVEVLETILSEPLELIAPVASAATLQSIPSQSVPSLQSIPDTIPVQGFREAIPLLDPAAFLTRPEPAPAPIELSLITPVPLAPGIAETLPLSTGGQQTVALLNAAEFLARPAPPVELPLIAPIPPIEIVSQTLALTEATQGTVPLIEAATFLKHPEPTPAPVELPLIAPVPVVESIVATLPLTVGNQQAVRLLNAAEFLARPTPPIELPLIAPSPLISLLAEPLPIPEVLPTEIALLDRQAFQASLVTRSIVVANPVVPEAVEMMTFPASPAFSENPSAIDPVAEAPGIVHREESAISVPPGETAEPIAAEDLINASPSTTELERFDTANTALVESRAFEEPKAVPIVVEPETSSTETSPLDPVPTVSPLLKTDTARLTTVSSPVRRSAGAEIPKAKKEEGNASPPPRRIPTPLSPALPGIARFLAVAGIIIAALGALARPLAELSPLSSLAEFVNGVESDSRIQTRNLQRREAGGALSPGLRKKARVVVILAKPRRGAAPDEYPIGRLELASLIRLCHAAEVPVIGLVADTGEMPLTTGIPAAGPLPGTKSDPLAVAIQEVSNASIQANPTHIILPAVFDQNVASQTDSAKNSPSGWTLTDPKLPRESVVTGFIGPSPLTPGRASAEALRRTFALTAPISMPENQGGGLAQAVSMPGALALLTMPGVSEWPQANGMELKDSSIPEKLASAFGYPPVGARETIGNHPVAIDFGLLQSDPEGVQVISDSYVRKLDDNQRRVLLQNRPVVIGLDRKTDRIRTPLSAPRFVFLPSVKPTMAMAEAEGRAAAMLLAHAEQKATDASKTGVVPPFPYQEPFPAFTQSIVWFVPAVILGYLLGLTGRRVAARPVRLGVDDSPMTSDEKSALFLRRITPAIVCTALAGVLGGLWRMYATPGFTGYLSHPGFSPWAAPWFAALTAAAVFGLASLLLWMLGIVWEGRGVAIIIVATVFTIGVLIVQDFALFPVWTPLLAPAGGLLLGAALTIGRRPSPRYKYQPSA